MQITLYLIIGIIIGMFFLFRRSFKLLFKNAFDSFVYCIFSGDIHTAHYQSNS